MFRWKTKERRRVVITGRPAETTVPYRHGCSRPVVLTLMGPLRVAVASHVARPAARPSSGDTIAAALDCRLHSTVSGMVTMPGHVTTPRK